MILYIGWLFDAKNVCITVRLQAQLQRCRVCVEYKFWLYSFILICGCFFFYFCNSANALFVREVNERSATFLYIQFSVALLSYVCRHRYCRSLYSGCHLIIFLFLHVYHGLKILNGEKNYNRFFMGFKMIWITRKMSKLTEIWSIFYIISK